ncbi:MAG: fructose-bisphosphate aldolase class I [Anaerolineales bacterium]|nr:fructose-bisphosphate aldolase class I [Anaerolineales bacterium]
MDLQKMEAVARGIVAPGKGVLAADESFPTIKKRFDSINIESTEENRRAYRELLFTTEGVEEFVGGVITFDETMRHKTADGTPFPDLLTARGIYPGVKVDKGTRDLALYPGEKFTQGLDGLRERLAEYVEMGATFTKWRTVYTIGKDVPTAYGYQINASSLAQYAALCQEAGLVPIVEPEVLMDGDHTLERCEEVTTITLDAVFSEMFAAGVKLEGILLKPNMILAGKGCTEQASVQEVAEATIRVLMRTVPPAVPGIVFLSGGQTPAQATENLSAMNAIGGFPWQLSFSYGRALQEETLKSWLGKEANFAAAQKSFYRRAKLNSMARYGDYSPDLETKPV